MNRLGILLAAEQAHSHGTSVTAVGMAEHPTTASGPLTMGPLHCVLLISAGPSSMQK
jgi:hypothetical protein